MVTLLLKEIDLNFICVARQLLKMIKECLHIYPDLRRYLQSSGVLTTICHIMKQKKANSDMSDKEPMTDTFGTGGPYTYRDSFYRKLALV